MKFCSNSEYGKLLFCKFIVKNKLIYDKYMK